MSNISPKDLPFVVLLLISAVFALYGLDRYYAVWSDEVFYTEPARQLYINGSLASPIFFNVRHLDTAFFLQPPAGFLIQSIIFRIFGFSQYAVRMPSVVYYLMSVTMMYVLVKNCLRPRIDAGIWALTASALFAFDNSITAMVGNGRPDSLVVLLILASITALSNATLDSRVSVFLSTLLGCLASLTHPAGAIMPAAVFLHILFRNDLKTSKSSRLLIFLACAALFTVPYLIYIAANFNVWQNQFIPHVMGVGSGFRFVNGDLPVLVRFIDEFKARPVIPILALIALFSPGKERFKSILIPAACFLPLLTVAENYYKFILPPLYAGIFVLLPYVFTIIRKPVGWTLCVLISLCLIRFVQSSSYRAYCIYSGHDALDPAYIDRAVADNIPEHSKVLSMPAAYYACLAHNIDFRYPGTLTGLKINKTAQDRSEFQSAVNKYKPDFLVLLSIVNPSAKFGFMPNTTFIKKYRYTSGSGNSLSKAGGDHHGINFTIWEVRYRAATKIRAKRQR